MIPTFSTGQVVRVCAHSEAGHQRTPGYVKGRSGRIVAVCGAFPDPSRLAAGELGLPYRVLYRVAFRQTDLWPDYSGPTEDDLLTDLYEHWLEPEERHP